MKKNSLKFLLLATCVVLFSASCATKKKYGCPTHISIQKLLGL